MYSDGTSDVVTRDVTKTCSYSAWASQEIVCDRNYMEVGPLLCEQLFLFLNWQPYINRLD